MINVYFEVAKVKCLLQDVFWVNRSTVGYQNWFYPHKNADYLIRRSSHGYISHNGSSPVYLTGDNANSSDYLSAVGHPNKYYPRNKAEHWPDFLKHSPFLAYYIGRPSSHIKQPDILYKFNHQGDHIKQADILYKFNHQGDQWHMYNQLPEIQHFQPQLSPNRTCVAEIMPGYKNTKRQWVKIDCDQQFRSVTIICESHATDYVLPHGEQ